MNHDPAPATAADAAPHAPSGPLWAELRDAIRGTNADYTRIPLRRAVATSFRRKPELMCGFSARSMRSQI